MKITAKFFNYQFDIHGKPYPLIPISAQNGNIREDFFCLIDSGSTISIFKTDLASKLNIDIEKGEEITMRSVTGWLKGYVHKINIKVSGKRFRCHVVFSNDYQASFSILGRSDFFERFKITFDEANKNVILS